MYRGYLGFLVISHARKLQAAAEVQHQIEEGERKMTPLIIWKERPRIDYLIGIRIDIESHGRFILNLQKERNNKHTQHNQVSFNDTRRKKSTVPRSRSKPPLHLGFARPRQPPRRQRGRAAKRGRGSGGR